MMRLLACGDRRWTSYTAVRHALQRLHRAHGISLLLHGGCQGADKLAALAATALGIPVQAYLPQWQRYGRAAGPVRNQQMLTQGKPTYYIAFHTNLKASRGTTDMLYRLLRARVPGELITTTSTGEAMPKKTAKPAKPTDKPLTSVQLARVAQYKLLATPPADFKPKLAANLTIVECWCTQPLLYSSGKVALEQDERTLLVYNGTGTVFAYRRDAGLTAAQQHARGSGLRYTFSPSDFWIVELDGKPIKQGRAPEDGK